MNYGTPVAAGAGVAFLPMTGASSVWTAMAALTLIAAGAALLSLMPRRER